MEGRKGKVRAEIKETGEDAAHPRRTNDRSVPFFTDGTIDYFLSLIAACAAANRAIGTRNGEQDT